MDAYADALNELLVDTYHAISKVEEEMLKKAGRLDLSIGELHMIEFIAKDKERGKSISEIAQKQDLSLPSVTIAINKLVKKGYVEKVRSREDGRMVFVKATREGVRADAVHQYFHRQMVRGILREICEEDKDALLAGHPLPQLLFPPEGGGDAGNARHREVTPGRSLWTRNAGPEVQRTCSRDCARAPDGGKPWEPV